MTTTQLTASELETVKILIRLGDSKELAEQTVLNEREVEVNHEFYRNAYSN